MQKVTLFPQSCKGMEDCGICAFVCPQSLFTASEEMNAAGYVPPMASTIPCKVERVCFTRVLITVWRKRTLASWEKSPEITFVPESTTI